MTQDHAKEIYCNGLTHNECIGLALYPAIKRAPMELGVEVSPRLNLSPIMPIGSAGLYSQDGVNRVQKVLTFGSERKAVENITARRAVGLETTGQGF
ncbi:hypothetical protein JTB14_034363 [Gonioctena quinquepunctata]|nr:hypothetical protein JTB14_034363 [Gonioctena quinquepunctata]